MADRLEIGQVWRRRRDGEVYRVRQIWRPDRSVLMIGDVDRVTVSFNELRRLWKMVR
jgi:hypothetical protein